MGLSNTYTFLDNTQRHGILFLDTEQWAIPNAKAKCEIYLWSYSMQRGGNPEMNLILPEQGKMRNSLG